jgi:hypothetical protein
MASRGRVLFVMPAEFCDLLRRTKDEFGLDVILYRGPSTPFERWDGRDETLTAATRVYLATAPAALEGAHPDSFRPGELGWVQLGVPRVENRDLFGVELAAKSDWFDGARQVIRESPVALKLFDRLLRKWKKQFAFGASATNVKHGGEAIYPSIGYSPGAAAWHREGGALRQTAVANIAYGIPSPDTRGLPRREP